MEIAEFLPHHLAALTAIYNDVTRQVPHCFPVEPQELAEAFSGTYGTDAEGKRLTAETVLVAVDDNVSGFIHVGEGHLEEGDESRPAGVVRFLAYPRGRRDVGQALLEHGEDWMRDRRLASVSAFTPTFRYPFYAFPHAMVSDRLDHIQALLLFNGYGDDGGEVFLDWPNMDPTFPEAVTGLDFHVNVEQTPSQGKLPNITLKADLDGQTIGTCVFLSASAFSQRSEVQEWAFCDWLNVTEPLQGRGLGRYLLGRALVEARNSGFRHAGISTAWDNHRALLFYSNHGFRAVDWTRRFRRDLLLSDEA